MPIRIRSFGHLNPHHETTDNRKRNQMQKIIIPLSILAVVILATLFAFPQIATAETNWYPDGMLPCEQDDSPGPCYWDGTIQGNKVGPRYWVDEFQIVHFEKPQVCTGDKIDVNEKDVYEITYDAPEGFLIAGYCVKASSVNQDLGPEYQAFDPGVETVTFSHSSGKEFSHYSITLVANPIPTTTTTVETPPTTISEPPTTVLQTAVPTTNPVPTIPPTTVSVPPGNAPMTTLPVTGNEPVYIAAGILLIAAGLGCRRLSSLSAREAG